MSAVSRAVRLYGTLGFTLLVAAAPILQLCGAMVRPKATPAWPACTLRELGSGRFTKGVEVQLREASLLTFHIRGIYTETLFELGWLDSPKVHFGRDGWLFLADELTWEPQRLVREPPLRARFLRQLMHVCNRLGVQVLAAIVPDKARVHGERLAADFGPRRGLYAQLLAEFAAAGIPAVDLATVFAAHRRADPGRELYYPHDTHWSGSGVGFAAQAIQRRLEELGWLVELAEPQALTPLYYAKDGPCDLAGVLGFRRGSAVELSLWDRHDGIAVHALAGEGTLPRRQEDAEIALCGTSFADQGLAEALSLALQRRVDGGSVVVAGGPFTGLLDVLGRIERGRLRARVLVWEFPERSAMDGSWAEPPEFPGSK